MCKQLLLTLCLLGPISIFGIHAQSFGIRAGFNFPGMLDKDEDEVYSDNNKIMLRLHIGGAYNHAITDNLSVEASLILSSKGVRTAEIWDDTEYTKRLNLLYLDIPVVARYTVELDKLNLYGLFGPYLAFGLKGKYKYTVAFNGDKDTDFEAVEWGNDPDDDLRIADGGLHLGVGTLLGNIQAGLYYELGIFNLSPNTAHNRKIKNRILGLTAVYYFKE